MKTGQNNDVYVVILRQAQDDKQRSRMMPIDVTLSVAKRDERNELGRLV